MSHLETYLDSLKLLPNAISRHCALLAVLDERVSALQSRLSMLEESAVSALNNRRATINFGTDQLPSSPYSTFGELPSIPVVSTGLSVREMLTCIRSGHSELLALTSERAVLATNMRGIIQTFQWRLTDEMNSFDAALPPQIRHTLHAPQSNISRRPPLSSASITATKLKSTKSSTLSSRFGSEYDIREVERERLRRQQRLADEELTLRYEDGEDDEAEEMIGADDDEEGGGDDGSRFVFGTAIALAAQQAAANDSGEQRFCICRGASIGDMIGCDDHHCQYQWFHFECVNIIRRPRGVTEWFCPECRKKH